jgi:putative addiction module component (TIGR02574 family)
MPAKAGIQCGAECIGLFKPWIPAFAGMTDFCRPSLEATVSAFIKKGYNANMNNISIADILELSVQERIRLVELIWDSVAAVPEAVGISTVLTAELEARLVEFEANPEAGYSWEQVKASLKNGAWRTA